MLANPPAMDLTRRELEVARLVAEGLTNRAIADRLFLSERTIEGHIDHAFTKLGISSRTQLARWLASLGHGGEAVTADQIALPLQLTSFIGRDGDIRAIRELMADHRIVTLTGVGGSGKTRLAIEIGRQLHEAEGLRVWFVDLSPLTDPALVVQATSTAIGVAIKDASPDGLIGRLHSAQGVIILDNCEHVVSACAALVGALVAGCPRLSFVATSREPLRAAGENVWHVQPLSVPLDSASEQGVVEAESVKLFVARARAIEPTFVLGDSNQRAVAEVCRRLDGLPLAIELAASRVGFLSPAQIASRLDSRFSLLEAQGQSVQPRHRTLAATLQWSFDLLEGEERTLFWRLSVFSGSFNLEAIEAICAIDPLSVAAVVTLLGRLIERSLVMSMQDGHGQRRYRLLDSTRAFANDVCVSKAEAPLLAERHARLYASIGLEAGRHLGGSDAGSWTDLIAEEMDNLRAALDWAISHDRLLALDVCASLAGYWDFHGWLYEGRHWLDRALTGDDGGTTRERAAALAAAGMLAFRLAEFAASRAFFESSVEIARAIGNRALTARALSGLGDALTYTGDGAGGAAKYEESLALYRSEGDLLGAARELSRLGGTYNLRGDLRTAEGLFRESLDAFRKLGDRAGIANQIFTLGCVSLASNRLESARSLFAESLTMRREIHDAVGTAWSGIWLGCAEIQLGHLRAACQPLAEGLIACQDVGDIRGLSIGLDMALGLLLAANQPAAALRVGIGAAQMRDEGSFETIPPFGSTVDRWLAEAKERLQDEETEREELLGRSMLPGALLDFALTHIRELEKSLQSFADVPLTNREIDIAQQVAKGMTNREIAALRHISERTVDTHVRSIIGKLGVRSRTQIAAWVTERSSKPSVAAKFGLAHRFVAAILMLDIVDSTRKVAEVGDRAWRALLDEHYRIVEKELKEHSGGLVDTAGDGLLATFEAPGEAIRCAWGIQQSDRRLGLSSRASVHCGEVERAGAAIRGIAVHLTSRLVALAGPGEVIVSSTTVELSAGSGIRFVHRGKRRLKGVAEQRQVFVAVEQGPSR
jgi:predicted ATPase/DNA-binding NarL/FixJ family response regulator